MKLLVLLFIYALPAFAGSVCESPVYTNGSRVIAGIPRLHLANFGTAYFPADQGDLNFTARRICRLCGWGQNAAEVKAGEHALPAYVVEFDEHNQVSNVVWVKQNQWIISGLACTP